MNDAISNSSPLILLAKIGHTNYLFSVFERIIIPPAVFDEVIKKGSEQGYPDAIELKDLYKKELVVLKKPKNVDKRIEKVKSLHLGEVEAISLALEYENTEILLDDEEARVFARNMGIKVKGALGLLVENYKKQLISRTEAKESLRKLNELMYL